jgi:hypothetical protein
MTMVTLSNSILCSDIVPNFSTRFRNRSCAAWETRCATSVGTSDIPCFLAEMKILVTGTKNCCVNFQSYWQMECGDFWGRILIYYYHLIMYTRVLYIYMYRPGLQITFLVMAFSRYFLMELRCSRFPASPKILTKHFWLYGHVQHRRHSSGEAYETRLETDGQDACVNESCSEPCL